MHFFEFLLLHSCNGNPGTTTTGYGLKGWGWYPAGQDNMWKALKLTDVSPAGWRGVRLYLVPRLAYLYTQRAVRCFVSFFVK
jgi:hypothetical protein